MPLPTLGDAGRWHATRDAQAARELLAAAVVRMGDTPEDGELLRASMEPNDGLELFVFANADGSQARLVARLDNLGKGASGAAVRTST
ncbi:MAG: hypothetical protein R3D89_03880 [Sphingomonadaceae bacterium]